MNRRAFLGQAAAMAMNAGVIPRMGMSQTGATAARAMSNKALTGNAMPLPAAVGAAANAVGGGAVPVGQAMAANRWARPFIGGSNGIHNGMNMAAGGVIGGAGGLMLGDEPGAVVGAGVGAMGGRGGAQLARRLFKARPDFGSNKYLAPGVAAGVGGTAAGGSLVLGGHLNMFGKNAADALPDTLEEAIEKLAELAAYHRTGPAEKTAAPEWLTSLGETVKNSPGLSHALVGGGLGAAAMGANTALNNSGQPGSKKKSVLGSMFAGGVAGAGAGAGVGLARQGLSELKNPGGGISGTDAMKPGQFTDPATGARMAIDPKALKDHPELASQVKSLTAPSFQSQVAGGVGGVLQGIKDKVPTTAPIVGGVATADLLMHNPLFGLSRIRPGQAGGQIGKELLRYGMKGNDEISSALRAGGNTVPSTGPAPTTGIDTHVKLNDKVAPSSAMRRMWEAAKGKVGMRPNPPTLLDAIGGRGGSLDGSREVATVSYTPELKGERVTKDPLDPKEYVKREETSHGPRTTKGIREADVASSKMFGHESHPQYKDRQLYRTFGRTYAGAKSLPAALGARALLYGTPMAAEYVGRGLQEDEQNKQTMRDIMARYAKPVPGGK